MCKLRVLMVDDNAIFLRTAVEFVAALPGVDRVECAESGAEALRKASESPPDLVLMDIAMSGMSGINAMRLLRERHPAPRMYAVTLHESAEYRAAAREAGAVDLIPKRLFATAIPALIALQSSECEFLESLN